MRHLIDLADAGKKANTLIILLPGANHLPEDFIAQGFVSAVRQRQLDIDLVMPELAFDQIADETVLRRMHDTVMQPYAALGYPNIWIAGISIGGYVAIAYVHRYAAQLKGLLLLAPYLGNRITTGEIASAGGVEAWAPSTISDDDIERGNWNWLKNHVSGTHRNTTEIYLGFGQDDRFAGSIAMVASILPAEYVDKIPGDHVWSVWQQLWHNFLDKRFST
jgi:pimeloyl-ACP methyl ester carboxylesterase